jgi:hypothetical protein
MDAVTLDRCLTDSLLIEASDGLEHVAAELEQLYRSWTDQRASDAALDWLATVITDVHWWSGRLLGGISFVDLGQEVPDVDGD